MPKMRPLITLSSLVGLTLFLVLAFAPASSPDPALLPRRDVYHRAILPIGDTTTTSSDPPTSAAPTSTTPTSTTTSSAPPTSTSSDPPASSTPAAPGSTSSQPPPTSAPASSTPTSAPTSASIAPGGSTVIVTATASGSVSSTASAAAASNTSNSGSSSSLGTSSIIGLSVAGGVAVLGIIAFFVWKFTRKRFSDLDDNEAIKWPELNAHDDVVGGTAAPLPTNRLGGAGFDTGASDISRPSSRAGYAASVGATSTTELYPAHADPYAVPPLPQYNPGQPYRDDPSSFYDPYRGPVPQTFDGAPAGGEAIPMTQLSGRRSPGPAAAYSAPQQAGGYSDYSAPQPGYVAYPDARSASPGPVAGGYGDRSRSPGPGAAMAMGQAGRASPAPGPGGYGGYGQR